MKLKFLAALSSNYDRRSFVFNDLFTPIQNERL